MRRDRSPPSRWRRRFCGRLDRPAFGAGILKAGEYEPVGDPPREDHDAPNAAAVGITSIALDDEGGAWVAGAKELGRWAPVKDALGYEPKGANGGITTLAACRRPSQDGVWVGTTDGLVRFDEGRGFVRVAGLQDGSVTALSLDDDGRGVWVGTRAHGVFRAAGDAGREVTTGDSIALDSVAGIAKTANGTRVAAGSFGDEGRIYALTMAGTEGFRAPVGQHVAGLVELNGDSVLLVGRRGEEQPHLLRPLGAAEFPPPRQRPVRADCARPWDPLGGGADAAARAAGGHGRRQRR